MQLTHAELGGRASVWCPRGRERSDESVQWKIDEAFEGCVRQGCRTITLSWHVRYLPRCCRYSSSLPRSAARKVHLRWTTGTATAHGLWRVSDWNTHDLEPPSAPISMAHQRRNTPHAPQPSKHHEGCCGGLTVSSPLSHRIKGPTLDLRAVF